MTQQNEELQQRLNKLGQERDEWLERLTLALEQQNTLATQQAAVIEQLCEALRSTSQTPIQAVDQVLPLAKAAPVLGYEDSSAGQQQLRRAIAGGLFRVGIEVQDRRLPNSQMPVYWLDIKKCEKRLETPPEHRGAA